MAIVRRHFLKQTALALSIPLVGCESAPSASDTAPFSALKRGDVLLFQGDSITDARREKTEQLPNTSSSFGHGYAFLAASYLLNKFPEHQFTIYNRGISGNKVFQLADRWQEDALDLKPNWVSVLIGVNDFWHKMKHGYEGTVEIYENDLRALLQRTTSELPGVRLIVCEPFILPNTSAVDQSWVEPFKAYQKAAHHIATELGALWVPFQTLFNNAFQHAEAAYWAPDGVHPSMAGSQLMANAWLDVLNKS